MRLTVRFDDHDHTLYADLSQSAESEPITFLSLQGKLEEAGYGDLKLHPDTVAELLGQARQGKEGSMALKTFRDATVSVSIDGDKRRAYVTLTAADGGRPLTLDMITSAIAKAGVADALVDYKMVNRCLERQSVTDVCIAQARLPIQGNDAVFIPLVESEATAPPQVDEHGVADMLNIHEFFVVDVGTPLMRRVPATEGEPGLDVTGKPIKPARGNDLSFASKLRGVEVSPNDPNVLVAALHGHPILLKNGVNVDPTLHVDQVDMNTGNITFDGSLEVKGEVAAGMTIDVTGDVFVKGGVERAAIKAGHTIKVGNGIVGGEDPERPEEKNSEYSIQAGLDIEAKFVHLAALVAERNVVVKEYISHSFVEAGNQVLLGQDGGKGILFGGQCEALHGVVMNQLGNEAYLPTHVAAGKLSELTKVFRKLEKELSDRSQEVVQLTAILEKIQRAGPTTLGSIPLDKSEKIRNTIIAINAKKDRIQELLHSLEPEMKLQAKAAIRVEREVYPNAVMTINGINKRFSDQTRGSTWVQWGDELLEQAQVEEENTTTQAKKEYNHAG